MELSLEIREGIEEEIFILICFLLMKVWVLDIGNFVDGFSFGLLKCGFVFYVGI